MIYDILDSPVSWQGFRNSVVITEAALSTQMVRRGSRTQDLLRISLPQDVNINFWLPNIVQLMVRIYHSIDVHDGIQQY